MLVVVPPEEILQVGTAIVDANESPRVIGLVLERLEVVSLNGLLSSRASVSLLIAAPRSART